jgi:hypothetical protein
MNMDVQMKRFELNFGGIKMRVLKGKPKRNFDTKLSEDNYEGYDDKPIPPKKVTPLKLYKSLSPSDLNTKLRILYQIPFSVNRNNIQPYLDKITNENHKYFLKRYAINGKEFDVCWLLLQEGL